MAHVTCFTSAISLFLTAAALAGSAQPSPATLAARGPGPRASHILVYDPAGRALLVDGIPIGTLNATDALWAWDGKRWRETDTRGPGPREADAASQRRSLFTAIGRTSRTSAERNSSRWVTSAKWPACSIRISFFSGAFTTLKYSTATDVGVAMSSFP
jgi:hypothetical protein